MTKVFGVHKGFRAFHAKGIVVEGSFKATPEAAALSKAVLFNGSEIPLTARFSNSTGVPNIPDGIPDANPHGISIKFHLPDGSESDLVINALKFFPVSSGADLRDLFLAIAASPPDAPKPTKIEQFVAAHPTIAAANATVRTPDSFASEEYHGVNAFVFVNKSGQKQAFRYRLVPERVVHLDPAEAQKKAPNFLIDEVQERLKKGPITFHLKAQLAAPGDQTSDGSKPWPDDRKEVDMGVLTITKVAADPFEAQNKLLFLPGQLPDGIEPSDDPMIDIRNAAYPISFARRQQ
jgi:catalase